MNLNCYYWIFPSALSHKFCDDVIQYALSKPEKTARTGASGDNKLSKEELFQLKTQRDSDVVWLSEEWIYNELHPYVHEANSQAGWNFQWDYSEAAQFTKYKLNQFYDWHMDSFGKPYDTPKNPDMHGKVRKLTMVCHLTDASEYEGGELEFDLRDYAPHMRDESQHAVKVKEVGPKGSIIVFPSHLWHRVKPVTKGTRYSMPVWHLGYPFK